MPNPSARGFARAVNSRQRLVHMIAARVDGTGTAALLSGSQELTLTDNGTGDYTLTLATPAQQVPTVLLTSKTSAVEVRLGTVTASAVQVLGFASADGTTATDCDFDVLIIASDAADEV